MQLLNCARLARRPVVDSWYRTVDFKHIHDGILARHTAGKVSRFSPGALGVSRFEVLYFSETPEIALEEYRFKYSVLASTRAATAARILPVTTIPVRIELSNVADLTHPDEADIISANAQELTGDWKHYPKRNRPFGCASLTHTGIAPTQQLGEALYDCCEFQGFLTYSAVKPDGVNLVVFPNRLTAPNAICIRTTTRSLAPKSLCESRSAREGAYTPAAGA